MHFLQAKRLRMIVKLLQKREVLRLYKSINSELLLYIAIIICWRPLDSRTRTTTSTRFSHSTTLSARKPASFWWEKRDTVVILVRGFAKMLSCQNKSRTRSQFWHFLISKKAQVPTMRITEQPILLTECRINRQGCKVSKYFR